MPALPVTLSTQLSGEDSCPATITEVVESSGFGDPLAMPFLLNEIYMGISGMRLIGNYCRCRDPAKAFRGASGAILLGFRVSHTGTRLYLSVQLTQFIRRDLRVFLVDP